MNLFLFCAKEWKIVAVTLRARKAREVHSFAGFIADRL